MTMMMKKTVSALVLGALLASGVAFVPAPAGAQPVRLKDVSRVQGVTANQLVGYGLVTGLAQSGDSTSVLFTSKSIQNVLQSFGLTTTSQDVRTRNVAAVIVTASLPAFAHSGDTIDVTVSSMGDATSLQGGTLILTELRAANNLVYATAQGPLSVGGFYATDQSGQNSIVKNHVTAGRIPQGAVLARDMITNIQQDQAGFSYVLTSPDFKTAARVAQVINSRFGAGTARANDAETIRINLPPRYAGDPVNFLADAGDLSINADALAKVVVNERTGTVVMGGDITLAACAIAHGNLSITITTDNKVVQPPGMFTTGSPALQSNTRITATESGRHLVYISGAATLAQVVRALNTIGVSPRDLIAIIQALRESGSLQADVQII
jgi:flagellar P-ring protein precursor FlgI